MFAHRTLAKSYVIDLTNAEDHDNLNFFIDQHSQNAGGLAKDLSLSTLLIEKHSNITKNMRAHLTHELMKCSDTCYLVFANEPETSTPPEDFVTIRYTYKVLGELIYNEDKRSWFYKENLFELDINEIQEKTHTPKSRAEMSPYELEIESTKNNPLFDYEYEMTYTPKHLGLEKYLISKSYTGHYFCLFKKATEGSTLADMIADEKTGKLNLSTKDRLQIAQAILVALDEQVHQQGLIHRNFTPDYIKLLRDPIEKNWKATITQYRLCKHFDDNDKNLPAKGNFLYSSPEAFHQMGTLESSDLYAAACIIIELFGSKRSQFIKNHYELFVEMESGLDDNGVLEGKYSSNDTYINESTFTKKLFKLLNAMTEYSKHERCSVPKAIDGFGKLIDLVDEADNQAHLTARINSL